MTNLERWTGDVARGLIEFDNVEAWDGIYDIITCKRALAPSGLPEMDYNLNPYGGCEHGCIYCYAPEVTHSDWRNWRVVKVKTNIVERLAKELPGLSGTIGIGTVTDPYQAAEKRFGLTRQCLEFLEGKGYPIHMHTKSDLILRDTELLTHFEGQVAVTLTGLDERRAKMTEPGAPLPERRLKALKELTEAGVNTYALIAPIMDHLEGHEKEFCDAIVSTGVKRAALDPVNMRPQLMARLDRMHISNSPSALVKIRSLLTSAGVEVRDVFGKY
ncbi:MAG: radical SAM protein [archaeon]|nr:radical SAM protein [archaeon]